jgi:hypothetical protein
MTEMEPEGEERSENQSTEGTTGASAGIGDMLSLFMSHPLSGQRRVLDQLSGQNTLIGGAVGSLLNVVALFLMIIGMLRGIFGPFIRMDGGDYAGLFVVCLIPVAALFGGFVLLGRLGKTGALDIQQSLFCAGLTLLPTTVALLLAWIWVSTVGMVKVVPILLIFGLSFSLLLIFGALVEMLNLDEQRAFLLTPTLVTVAMILASIMASLVM